MSSSKNQIYETKQMFSFYSAYMFLELTSKWKYSIVIPLVFQNWLKHEAQGARHLSCWIPCPIHEEVKRNKYSKKILHYPENSTFSGSTDNKMQENTFSLTFVCPSVCGCVRARATCKTFASRYLLKELELSAKFAINLKSIGFLSGYSRGNNPLNMAMGLL